MKYLLPLATLFMTACTDSDKEDATEEEEGNFSPSEGLWILPEPTMTSDTCDFGDDGGDTGGGDTGGDTDGDGDTASLTLGENGAFTLVIGPDSEDSQSFECMLDAQDFTCANSGEEPMDGLDANLVMAMTVSGSFSSADAFTGGMAMNISCTGADCAMLADFGVELPCSMEGNVEGTFVE